jgi:hypothetical protein
MFVQGDFERSWLHLWGAIFNYTNNCVEGENVIQGRMDNKSQNLSKS